MDNSLGLAVSGKLNILLKPLFVKQENHLAFLSLLLYYLVSW